MFSFGGYINNEGCVCREKGGIRTREYSKSSTRSAAEAELE